MANQVSVDSKGLAILTHVLGLFTSFLGPLIIYLIIEDKEVKSHAKVVLNWQISFTIYTIISTTLMVVLIGFVLLPILMVLNIVFSIIGAIKANDGVVWYYPLSIPLIK